MTRAEHVQWCKQRALAYIDAGDVRNGVTSMLSDLGKHPETADLTNTAFLMSLTVEDARTAREFINGFAE